MTAQARWVQRAFTVLAGSMALMLTHPQMVLAAEPEREKVIYNEETHCLTEGAYTTHGAAVWNGPGGNPATGVYDDAPRYIGRFRAVARSEDRVEMPLIGAGFDCLGMRDVPDGDLQVKTRLIKLGANESPAICVDIPWTATTEESYSFTVNIVGKNGVPPCGNGFYKIEAWARMRVNGAFEPSSQICASTNSNFCIPQVITPDWHEFYFTPCDGHNQPPPPNCPTNPIPGT